jgi:hypothetical protein
MGKYSYRINNRTHNYIFLIELFLVAEIKRNIDKIPNISFLKEPCES